MANEKNLRVPTSSEARENGKKGGIASGKARRQKKLLRECLEILLEKEMTDKKGETMTGAEALSAKLFKEVFKETPKNEPKKELFAVASDTPVYMVDNSRTMQPVINNKSQVKVSFCPLCGTKLMEGSNFCHLCGARMK